MNDSARPLTAWNRDRAIGRLRTLTTGTALAGLVATGAFGALAAANYSGHTTTDTTGTGSTGTSSTGTAATARPTTSDETTSGSSNSSSTLNSTLNTVTTPTKKAHVTTGGSG